MPIGADNYDFKGSNRLKKLKRARFVRSRNDVKIFYADSFGMIYVQSVDRQVPIKSAAVDAP